MQQRFGSTITIWFVTCAQQLLSIPPHHHMQFASNHHHLNCPCSITKYFSSFAIPFTKNWTPTHPKITLINIPISTPIYDPPNKLYHIMHRHGMVFNLSRQRRNCGSSPCTSYLLRWSASPFVLPTTNCTLRYQYILSYPRLVLHSM